MGMWNAYRRRQFEVLARRALRGLDESSTAKKIAGTIPGSVGQIVGAGRGIVHDAEAIRDGAVLAANLVNLWSPRHQAAVQSVASSVQHAKNYVKTRAENRDLLLDDARTYGKRLNEDLNPQATPMARSFEDEMRRRLNIGMNQGEAVYNVATAVLPVAAELKSTVDLGRFAEAGAAKYLKMGASPELAEYLASPYEGMGHHSIIPRRAKSVAEIPIVNKTAKLLKVGDAANKVLGDLPIPKSLLDSPFNVVKPQMERGQMYRRHVGLDKHYYGGKAGAEFGGVRWSSKDLGWTKYDPATQLWYGTPGTTKGVLLGGPAILEGLGQFTPEDELAVEPPAASPPRPRRAGAKK